MKCLMRTALVVTFLASVVSVGQAQLFMAHLLGTNEFPPNASPGVGDTIVTFDPLAHTMRVQVTFAGLLAANTAAHIHCCTLIPNVGNIGVATVLPTFTGFPGGVTAGPYDHTFDMTLASSYNPSFMAAHGGTPLSAEFDLLQGVLAGRAYLNIHSTAFPGGEIRGFLAPEPGTVGLLAGLVISGTLFAIRRRSRKVEMR